ncbi:hypothetical protein TVAG_253100 [Trichomonas vaginalis G3]|uniref:Uncharacterized protein n=1 Tax=Trichomonas vaginalis (strain ATCC PRA-98 / G3) TaxID=412133 RepID=A2EXG9_TRIV3|nr:protein ubiquitination [Trichomonas vaginalis G3]EAY02659.1 hypothetical protein TVAG_253100 [Trichomonas vaginalis G3]KAI5550155.1 protein ubiquitination [Trichomonas vaginalis G3]|eukprot:XP_001314882.1 hypothetical protein [Trichomonas vaginalis G3]
MLIDENRPIQQITDITVPAELEDIVDLEDKLWAANIDQKEELIEVINNFLQKYPSRDGYIVSLIDYISQRRYKMLSFYADLIIGFYHHYDQQPLSTQLVQILHSRGKISLPPGMDPIDEEEFIGIFKKGTLNYALVWDDVDFLVNLSAENPDFDFTAPINATPLIGLAARNGSINCFKFLLLNGNVVDDMTANYAIRGGNLEIVRLCQQKGSTFIGGFIASLQFHFNDIADFMLQNFTSHRPELSDVISYYNTRAAIFFILNGDDINLKSQKDEYPLIKSIFTNQIELSRYLISHGANVNIKDFSGQSALHYAVRSPIYSKDAIQVLIENGADINSQNSHGDTALMLSLQQQKLYLLKMLLDYNKYNFGLFDQSGMNIIDKASFLGNNEAIELLLDHGCDVNLKNNDGYIPLSYALLGKQYEAAKLLLSKGADPSNINSKGESEIFVCIRNNNLEGCQILVDNGCDVNTPHKEIPLIHAIKKSKFDIVKLLSIYENCNINIKDELGKTPLMYAATNSSVEIVSFLLSKGANINEIDNSNISALIYSVKNKNEESAIYLLEHGADIKIKTGNNKSVLNLAVSFKLTNFVRKIAKLGFFKDDIEEIQAALDLAKRRKYTEIENILNEIN